MKKLVIIPTFNEKENIESICSAVMELQDFDVLVVDDSSPDGTSDLVKNLQAKFPHQLFLEVRKEKNGLGMAYVHGFKWAIERGYDYIFEMDADFSHNPKDLKRLVEALDLGADVAVGSRYSSGVNVVNWPMKRVLMSYFASKYVNLVTNLPISDATAGFVGYKRKVLEDINVDKVKFKGYGFQVEMKYKAWNKKFKIVEVPIVFTDRTLGESKISNSIISEAVIGIIMLRVRKILGKL